MAEETSLRTQRVFGRIDEALFTAVRALAAERGTSISSLIEDALQALIERQRAPKPEPRPAAAPMAVPADDATLPGSRASVIGKVEAPWNVYRPPGGSLSKAQAFAITQLLDRGYGRPTQPLTSDGR
jgi:hypothetical protein